MVEAALVVMVAGREVVCWGWWEARGEGRRMCWKDWRLCQRAERKGREEDSQGLVFAVACLGGKEEEGEELALVLVLAYHLLEEYHHPSPKSSSWRKECRRMALNLFSLTEKEVLQE